MNIFDTVISPLRRLRPGGLQDPARDWLVLLISSVIVLAGIIVWNVWAFDTVASGGAIGSAEPKATPLFSRATLEEIRTIFADRAAEEAKYVTGVYRYADPSQ